MILWPSNIQLYPTVIINWIFVSPHKNPEPFCFQHGPIMGFIIIGNYEESHPTHSVTTFKHFHQQKHETALVLKCLIKCILMCNVWWVIWWYCMAYGTPAKGCIGRSWCVYSIWRMPFSWTATSLILADRSADWNHQTAESTQQPRLGYFQTWWRWEQATWSKSRLPSLCPLVSQRESRYGWLVINSGYTTAASACIVYVTEETERNKKGYEMQMPVK